MARVKLNSNLSKNFNDVGRRTTKGVGIEDTSKNSSGRTQSVESSQSHREKSANSEPMIQWSNSAPNVKTHAGKHVANLRGKKIANVSANRPSIANKASKKMANAGSLKKYKDH